MMAPCQPQQQQQTEPKSEGLKECDLVMKGGITSGVVYPSAVKELSTAYRFRQIGGTSAGAMAAALTAAAELARTGGGFDRLEKMSQALSQPGFVRGLFQPSAATAPAMTVCEYGIQRMKTDRPAGMGAWVRFLWGAIPTLRRAFPSAYRRGWWGGMGVGFLATALISSFASAIIAVVSAAMHRPQPRLAIALITVVAAMIVGLLCGRVGGLCYAIREFWRTVRTEVPVNFFGLCNGSTDEEAPKAAPLTDWLARSIDDIAGRPADGTHRPLTFKDLLSAPRPITLRMVTTNLSQNRPFTLPFRKNDFLFREADMRRLFPTYVVDYLIKAAHPSETRIPPEGFYFLPPCERLPVVVAARLSLSFPMLVSMVPLYSIDPRAYQRKEGNRPLQLNEEDLKVNWFSDGGISSNFPIHFFDAWLPARPSFGINLTELPDEALLDLRTGQRATPKTPPDQQGVNRDFFGEAEPEDSAIADVDMGADGDAVTEGQAQAASATQRPPPADPKYFDAVYLPTATRPPSPTLKPIRDLPSLFMNIWTTAQNYHDNMQATLPSYRERIVEIFFAKDEGGLNLSMKPETIDAIRAKGRRAGELLCKFDFERHRWVRLRVLLGQLELRLTEMKDSVKTYEEYERIVNTQQGCSEYPYRKPEEGWCKEARARIKVLSDFIDGWVAANQKLLAAGRTQGFFAHRSPKPDASLRIMPDM